MEAIMDETLTDSPDEGVRKEITPNGPGKTLVSYRDLF